MLTTRVALVPYDNEVEADCHDAVVAALNDQIRIVSQAWSVSATIEWQPSLEAMRPECIPLVILAHDAPFRDHGIHLTLAGRPFALIKSGPGSSWSRYASHELIELLCNPYGGRTTPARSLKEEQGEVDYLVEVCDPCEYSTYKIENVVVSDFVTPDYYQAKTGGDTSYSHEGLIKKPLQLLAGGYIAWQTRPGNAIWQAFAGQGEDNGEEAASEAIGDPRTFETDELSFNQLRHDRPGYARSGVTRTWVDLRGTRFRAQGAGPSGPPKDRGGRESYADHVRKGVETFLYLANAQPPPPTTDELIAALRANAPKAELGRLGVTPYGPNPKIGQSTLVNKVISALEEQQKISSLFGEDVFGFGLSSWLNHLMP
jgi:hypothetical protein